MSLHVSRMVLETIRVLESYHNNRVAHWAPGNTTGLPAAAFGSVMDQCANSWLRYFIGEKANFMATAVEDTGTLAALAMLSQAGRVDLARMLVLRTLNYDKQAPAGSAAESLRQMAGGRHSFEALEAAERVRDRVVRDIVEPGAERKTAIPSRKSSRSIGMIVISPQRFTRKKTAMPLRWMGSNRS